MNRFFVNYIFYTLLLLSLRDSFTQGVPDPDPVHNPNPPRKGSVLRVLTQQQQLSNSPTAPKHSKFLAVLGVSAVLIVGFALRNVCKYQSDDTGFTLNSTLDKPLKPEYYWLFFCSAGLEDNCLHKWPDVQYAFRSNLDVLFHAVESLRAIYEYPPQRLWTPCPSRGHRNHFYPQCGLPNKQFHEGLWIKVHAAKGYSHLVGGLRLLLCTRDWTVLAHITVEEPQDAIDPYRKVHVQWATNVKTCKMLNSSIRELAFTPRGKSIEIWTDGKPLCLQLLPRLEDVNVVVVVRRQIAPIALSVAEWKTDD